MIYPNLIELVKYHPYSTATLADHADMTTELMEEVIKGNEDLQPEEKRKIAQLYQIPVRVLFLPKMIHLDKENRRHIEMVEKLMAWLPIVHKYQQQGSKEADSFMIYGRVYLVNLELSFRDNRATYGQYLGMKERVEQAHLFIENELRNPRGLERRTER